MNFAQCSLRYIILQSKNEHIAPKRLLMISSSLTHLRNVATSTTVPSTLWPLKPLNMANFYGKSDQNTIGHSGALGGKAMYVLFWFVFFCTRGSFWFERSNIHNLPHFRVSSKHVAGSISEGVMCLTLMLCRCLSRFGPKRGS